MGRGGNKEGREREKEEAETRETLIGREEMDGSRPGQGQIRGCGVQAVRKLSRVYGWTSPPPLLNSWICPRGELQERKHHTSPLSIFPEVEASYSHGGQEEGSEPTHEPIEVTYNKTTNKNGPQNGCCISGKKI